MNLLLSLLLVLSLSACSTVGTVSDADVGDAALIATAIYAEASDMSPERAQKAIATVDAVESLLLASVDENGVPNFDEAKQLIAEKMSSSYQIAAIGILSMIQRRVEVHIDPGKVEKTKRLLVAAASGARSGLSTAIMKDDSN